MEEPLAPALNGSDSGGAAGGANVQAVDPVVNGGATGPVAEESRMHLYEMGKIIGRGGYSVVHKGKRLADGLVVAIKRIDIFELSAKKRARCLAEVKLLQSLQHPHIISMLDSFLADNMLTIIIEWAGAGDLKRLLRKTKEAGRVLAEPEIWAHFLQIADALTYMHSCRIMHRDIKPANVLVTSGGTLKLGDLGLGRHFSHATNEAFSKVGTPYYCSPEVVQGTGYDWKSDMWSLGCLLHELAIFASPFEAEGSDLYAVFRRVSRAEYTPLPAAAFSRPLRSLATALLSLDPAGRPSAAAAAEAARNAVSYWARESKGGDPTPPPPQQQQQQQPAPPVFVPALADAVTAAAAVADRVAILRRESVRFKHAYRPPPGLLPAIHATFFACPYPHRIRGATGGGGAQPPMNGWARGAAATALATWLLRLLGDKDAGGVCAGPSTGGHPGNAGHMGDGSASIDSGDGGSGGGDSTASGPTEMAARLLQAAAAVGGGCLSAATGCSAASLASGHGPPVCTLLCALGDAALAHLRVICARPTLPPPAPPEPDSPLGGAAASDDVSADGDEMMAFPTEDGPPSPKSAAKSRARAAAEEEADAAEATRKSHPLAYYFGGGFVADLVADLAAQSAIPPVSPPPRLAPHASRDASRDAPDGDCRESGDGQEAGGEGAADAWRAETDRVGPELRVLTLRHGDRDWRQRAGLGGEWDRTHTAIDAAATEAMTAARAVGAAAGADADAIVAREATLAHRLGAAVGRHAAAAAALAIAGETRDRLESGVAVARNALSKAASAAEATSAAVEEALDAAGGGARGGGDAPAVVAVRRAVARLAADVAGLELQMALARRRLALSHLRREQRPWEPGGE